MLLPTEFIPRSFTDFAGAMQDVARLRLGQCAQYAQRTTGNFRLLLHGPPGNGKSSLARLCAYTLTNLPDDGRRDPSFLVANGALFFANGRDVSLECLRSWGLDLRYRPMLPAGASGRRVILIEECDGIGPAALDHWRTFSDTLPAGVDVVLTTNKTLQELQPQLQSRCQQSPCPRIANLAIARLLERFGLSAATAQQIALAAKGDVRGALGDAETTLAAGAMATQPA